MGYLQSNKIAAFPVVSRNTEVSGDVYARHTSEEILSGIVNKLIDSDGFVITQRDDFKLTEPFAFNVHGYYFRVKTLQDLIDIAYAEGDGKVDTGMVLWAGIGVEKNGSWWELGGGDETEESGNEDTPDPTKYKYQGVNFTLKPENEEPRGWKKEFEEYYYTPLIQKTEPNSEQDWNGTGFWVIPKAYLKFSGTSFVIERIDGGDLNKKFK